MFSAYQGFLDPSHIYNGTVLHVICISGSTCSFSYTHVNKKKIGTVLHVSAFLGLLVPSHIYIGTVLHVNCISGSTSSFSCIQVHRNSSTCHLHIRVYLFLLIYTLEMFYM